MSMLAHMLAVNGFREIRPDESQRGWEKCLPAGHVGIEPWMRHDRPRNLSDRLRPGTGYDIVPPEIGDQIAAINKAQARRRG
jgi:hypothetical protein